MGLHGRLVLLLEDLSFFDSASYRLLSAAVTAMPADLLVVATLRPDGYPSVPAEGSSVSGAQHGSTGGTALLKVLQVLCCPCNSMRRS